MSWPVIIILHINIYLYYTCRRTTSALKALLLQHELAGNRLINIRSNYNIIIYNILINDIHGT